MDERGGATWTYLDMSGRETWTRLDRSGHATWMYVDETGRGTRLLWTPTTQRGCPKLRGRPDDCVAVHETQRLGCPQDFSRGSTVNARGFPSCVGGGATLPATWVPRHHSRGCPGYICMDDHSVTRGSPRNIRGCPKSRHQWATTNAQAYPHWVSVGVTWSSSVDAVDVCVTQAHVACPHNRPHGRLSA